MSVTSAVLALAWIAIIILALAMAALVRAVRVLSQSASQVPMTLGPRIGTRVPNFLDADAPATTFALFVDASCKACDEVLPAFRAVAADEPNAAFIAAYRGAARVDDARTITTLGHQDALMKKLNISFTPFLVALGQDSVVRGAWPVGGADRLEPLVRQSIEGTMSDESTVAHP